MDYRHEADSGGELVAVIQETLFQSPGTQSLLSGSCANKQGPVQPLHEYCLSSSFKCCGFS